MSPEYYSRPRENNAYAKFGGGGGVGGGGGQIRCIVGDVQGANEI